METIEWIVLCDRVWSCLLITMTRLTKKLIMHDKLLYYKPCFDWATQLSSLFGVLLRRSIIPCSRWSLLGMTIPHLIKWIMLWHPCGGLRRVLLSFPNRFLNHIFVNEDFQIIVNEDFHIIVNEEFHIIVNEEFQLNMTGTLQLETAKKCCHCPYTLQLFSQLQQFFQQFWQRP